MVLQLSVADVMTQPVLSVTPETPVAAGRSIDQ